MSIDIGAPEEIGYLSYSGGLMLDQFDAHTPARNWWKVDEPAEYDWFIPSESDNRGLEYLAAALRNWLSYRQQLSLPGLPPNFSDVEAAVRESRAILDLEENWAGEDNPRFQEATWQRAADFILDNTKRLWQTAERDAPIPSVQPVGDGSIDIEWGHEGRNLLVNVPMDTQQPASFYARDGARQFPIKGQLDTSANNEWLLMWLGA